MRITNIGATPRYFNFVGRTLKPGEASHELPLAIMHERLLWSDHDAGQLAIRLSDADKATLKRIHDADRKAFKVKVLEKKPEPKKVYHQPKPDVPMNPAGTPQGMPDFGRPAPVMPPTVPGVPSLAELKLQNQARKAEALQNANQLLQSRV